MILIISGPQGSGKGTQAKKIAQELGLLHMESGDLLRDIAKNNKRIADLQKKGILVPDQETLDYMEDYLEKENPDFDNIIFDGYPRSIDQYNLMKDWLAKRGRRIDGFIYLHISDKEAVKRLSARRVCKSCEEVYNLITKPPKGEKCDKCEGDLIQRTDDKPEGIKKRLSIFHTITMPTLKQAEKDTVFLNINGERPINVIFADIVSKLKNVKKH